MFNNLKSKVVKDNFLKENKNDDNSSKNGDISLNRTNSIESLSSTGASENKSRKRDETIKKWESKVSNLVCTVRERNATIKELEMQIQRDKIEYDKKIVDLKESSALNVQSLLDEHRTQLQEVEQDRDNLKRKLIETKSQLDAIRSQCFSLGEERENIDDLNKQELSKVKHLLLLRDADYEKLEMSNDEIRKKMEKLEVLNKGLKFEVDKKDKDLVRLIKEREVESEERRSQQITIRGLLTDKENLETRCEESKDKLTKTEAVLMNVERSSADLHTKLQQITRDFDQLKMKHSRLETEKSDRESDLKDRIRSLESHLALVRDTEQVDDRIKILEDKCFQWENKCIEERHLKDDLLNSWSDRVNCLELQIANLNSKIAEDAEEISQYNQVKANIRDDYERQIADLKTGYGDQEKKLVTLQMEVDQYSGQRNDEQNKWRITEDKLHSEFQLKVIECSNLTQENLTLKKDLNKLQDQHNSLLIELKSNSAMVVKLRDDINKLKFDVEEKSDEISALTSERFKRELKLTELNSQVASLEATKADLLKSSVQTDTDFKSIQIQIKRLNEEKTILSKKLETANEQYHCLKRECDQRIKTMQGEVESRARELEVSYANLKDLQDQMQEIEGEQGTVLVNIESSEVLQLKNDIEKLSAQLSDKSNIIRTQKQKIIDLKKTLGREIRFNNNIPKSSNNDDISVDSRIEDRSSYGMSLSNQSDNVSDNGRVMSVASINADVGSSSGDDGPVVVDRNGYVIMDQINFKYLKHVIVKFLLSKESEAVQLIKVVSILLRLTKDEESRIRSVLERRGHWFPGPRSSGPVPDQLKKSRLKK